MARKRDEQIVVRGMIVKHCSCGHQIGVETPGTRFFDGDDWDKPIEVCPSCNTPIEQSQLEFSPEQTRRLMEAYDLLHRWAQRQRMNSKSADSVQEGNICE